jgi:V-type H+-transporting ATPase subunit C
MVWWLISVPYEDKQSRAFKQIQKDLKELKLCEVFEFKVPKLKTSTLDTMMTLGDDLAKHDQALESIMSKVLRTLNEVSGLEEKDFIPAVVMPDEQIFSAEVFTTFFQWDDNQYLISKSLTDIVNAIVKKCSRYDEELKIKVAEYQTLRNNAGAIQRKTQGPLTTRSLDGIIRPEHIFVKDSEYLQTLYVIVPKKDQQEFENNYEDLEKKPKGEELEDHFKNTVGMCVVPNSADIILEDAEHILYSVVLLRKKAQDFKEACTSKKWHTREFEYDSKRAELAKMEAQDLTDKIENTRTELYEWTKTAFSECYSAWLHLKAVRIFVESVLRYGLPPQFCSVLLKIKGNETKVHKYFREHYKHLLNDQPAYVEDESMGALAQQLHGMEFHPYVLITLNVNQYPLLKMDK